MRKKQFFCFLFRNFSIFERNFFRLLAKSSKSCENYILRVHSNNLWLQNFSKRFEPFWIFFRNLEHGSQISIYESRVKIAEETVFLFFFSDFFRILREKIFQTFGQKTSKSSQNYLLRVQRNSLWLEIFFLKFCIVLDFLQKPSAWFSNFYPLVQSKNCGRNSFFCFLFRIFSIFERNFDRLLANFSKSCENYLLRVHRNNLWLQKNLKRFEPFWIFCRNLWHGSQISIYVSRVKIAEETVFLFFFSEFFRILREKFFRLSAKICQKFVKTTFYVSRGTICGLNFF